MMKEITVVMPVYKVEKYVSECLDSIINQTFDCFECIIIDDCLSAYGFYFYFRSYSLDSSGVSSQDR